MKNKENKKASAKNPKPKDLVAEAIARMGDKPLFPEKAEAAREYMRNAKFKDFEGL